MQKNTIETASSTLTTANGDGENLLDKVKRSERFKETEAMSMGSIDLEDGNNDDLMGDPRLQETIEVVDDIFALRIPGTRWGTAFEPIEPNPFPVGSIIHLDIKEPREKITKQSKIPANQDKDTKATESGERLAFEVTHAYWPPTMSTVYRVRRLKQCGDATQTSLTVDDYDEAIIKIFEPRLCKERVYLKNFVDRVDIFLKRSEENEQAARRFLLSDRDTFFEPCRIYRRTRAVIERLQRVAGRFCKEDNCDHRDCKIDDEGYVSETDELESELGEGKSSFSALFHRCPLTAVTSQLFFAKHKYS